MAGEGWGGASIQHAVTRSVRDSAALLDVVCGPQQGDPYFLARPERPFFEEVGKDPGKLAIAFTAGALASDSLDPECAQAVRDTARLLQDLGHMVDEVHVPGDLAAMQRGAGDVIAASIAATLDAEGERRGRPVAEGEVEMLTWAGRSYAMGNAHPDVIAAASGRTVANNDDGVAVVIERLLNEHP